MKTAMIIWNLGFVISICTTFGLASKNRHKPRHDEIERVINETHSVIWKCKENSECNPGLGLNVHCGTSIPFSMPIKCVPCVKGANFSETNDHSTCKSCRNCGKYEEKSGECTPEEDTTACLGTCHKGFYMDEITGGCHPCSDCCGQYEKYHEKQCKNSGLPSKTQCRENNCHQPTKENPTTPNHDKPGSPSNSEIAGIVVGIISALVIVVAVILIACCGLQKIKSTLKSWCCCCCHLVISNFENSRTIVFDGSESQLQGESQFATGKSGHHFPGTPEETTKSLKKPGYQRMQSVPVESKQEPINKFPRSHSHPGALMKLINKQQEPSEVNCSSLRLFRSPRRLKKGYIPVPTFEPSDVDNIPESSLKPVHVVVQQPDTLNPLPAAAQPVPDNEDIPQTSSQSVDVGVRQQSKLETEPVPDIEVSPENSSQSFDVVVRHQGKLEGLEKLSMSTSTTGLFDQPGTSLQFADIPQEFLSNYLSQKISAIPIPFYREICKKLDILRRINWDDYRQLGEIVGLDKDVLLWLGQRGNPTQEILQQFDSKKGSSVGKFKIIVEHMGRDDVVAIIENWILLEWHKNINSSSVRPQLKTFL